MNVAFLLISALGSATTAAPPAQMPTPTVLGPKAFYDGDVIEITDVRSTSPRLEQGDAVTVRGRYRLHSRSEAQLALYLTQFEGDGPTEVDKTQKMHVEKLRGKFELKTTIKHRGVLHVTFYDLQSGEPFGGVYFGTRQQMKRIADWDVVSWYLDEGAKELAD